MRKLISIKKNSAPVNKYIIQKNETKYIRVHGIKTILIGFSLMGKYKSFLPLEI